jgi:hypothetical protein
MVALTHTHRTVTITAKNAFSYENSTTPFYFQSSTDMQISKQKGKFEQLKKDKIKQIDIR